ncbi:MAG: sodium/proline symporter [Phycisphaerales bacterium]|nr:sodium/proline symporter [Phycisphaerales bacterium]
MPPELLPKLLALLLYGVILIVLGLIASRRMRDVREYFAGGKRMGFLSVAFSSRATGESAWLLLGLTGMGAAVGVKAYWVVLGELLGVGLAWMVMSRRFKRLTDTYDSVTIPDYLESRFRDSGHLLRLIAAGTLVVFVTIYVSAQIDATGKAFESMLGFNELFAGIHKDAGYVIGAVLGFILVLIYITSGGFVAVVWSDVFQGLMMVVGLVALPIVAYGAVGGMDPLLETLRRIDPALLHWNHGEGLTLLSVASLVGLMAIGLGFLGSPQVFVRFIALRSEREIPKGTAVAIIWTILADSGAVSIGILGRALYEGHTFTDYETILPMLVGGADVAGSAGQLLPAFVGGLFIAVVLSAIMSTIDSLLVVAGSAAVRDYYQKTIRPDLPDESLVRASRMATFIIACLGLLLALIVAMVAKDRSIFWFVIFGWSGIAATFCPTIILSLFWKGMTSRGAKFAMVTGFICVPVFKFGFARIDGDAGRFFTELDVLGPSFLISGIVGVVISLTDPRGRARVADFDADLRAATEPDQPPET